MKIGLISDTHGIFREDWLLHLTSCDFLIHAGDINTKNCYERFNNLGIPIYMVRGNCDQGEWAELLPEFIQIPFQGKLFYVVHNKSNLPFDLTDADFIIYGHTHCYEYADRYGKIFINPGSAGQPRYDARSMAILELTEDSHTIKRIYL